MRVCLHRNISAFVLSPSLLLLLSAPYNNHPFILPHLHIWNQILQAEYFGKHGLESENKWTQTVIKFIHVIKSIHVCVHVRTCACISGFRGCQDCHLKNWGIYFSTVTIQVQGRLHARTLESSKFSVSWYITDNANIILPSLGSSISFTFRNEWQYLHVLLMPLSLSPTI